MATRKGKTVITDKKPAFIASAAVVGKKEGEGPLRDDFDKIFEDTTLGQDSWEKAESFLMKNAVITAVEKAGVAMKDIDGIFSGDLLNQCTGSAFALREFGIPFTGLYGACSTMALSLITATLAIESGGMNTCVAATSSHFCSAEKQFRYPLEYGGQRSPTAQWTVTGSGAAVLSCRENSSLPFIDKVHIGTIEDLGIKDMTNMGAAMAPAAFRTLSEFFRDTQTSAEDYDAIFTGDLGFVGSELLKELMKRECGTDLSKNYSDCGLMIYDREKQDVHSGGSGCGCSASVLCSHILKNMNEGKYSNILFMATGALMSPVSSKEGESIPGIAHLLNIKRRERK
ncbi:MAG: stage V sporulation protein AD [Clostridia bacterium]|nr:stage V sporulation protein AD [Clostridia bacterium]